MKTNLSILIMLFAFIQMAQGQNTWVQKAYVGTAPRMSAVGFSIGNKGYIGTGQYQNGWGGTNDFWEYDPLTDIWTQKASIINVYGARYQAVGFSIGTRGYLGTGVHSGSFGTNSDFFEYDPATNLWTQKADVGGAERSRAVGFSIWNKGYVGTGNDGNLLFNDFWEYDPTMDTWTQKADFPEKRTGATGFHIGNKGYVGTGMDSANTVKNDFWEYDPTQNTWTQKSDLPIARRDAHGFSIGSKGYIGTGYDTTYKNDFWEYSPTSNSWIQRANYGGGNRAYTVGFSIGNKGYVGTGMVSNQTINDFWEYTPDTITAISELSHSNTTSIYPNPSHGSFILSYHNSTSPSIFKIMDAAGKIVYTQKLSAVEGTQKINATALRDGIYYYEVLSDDKVMGVGKLVVVR